MLYCFATPDAKEDPESPAIVIVEICLLNLANAFFLSLSLDPLSDFSLQIFSTAVEGGLWHPEKKERGNLENVINTKKIK